MWETLLQLATVPWNDTRDSILVPLKYEALTLVLLTCVLQSSEYVKVMDRGRRRQQWEGMLQSVLHCPLILRKIPLDSSTDHCRF